jgi:hypothetical protein
MLIPVGAGAGAQRSSVCKLVAALAPMVKFGKVQLLLNAGDHAHISKPLKKSYDKWIWTIVLFPTWWVSRNFDKTKSHANPTPT